MASHSDVEGEGFQVLGDEEGKKEAEEGRSAEPADEGRASPKSQKVAGEGFQVLDHEEPEPSAPEESAEQTQDDGGQGADSALGGEPEQAAPIDVYSVLRLSVAQLAGVAWQMMGLQPDPFTNQVRKDMAQARVAIDAAAALVEHLKPHLQGRESRDYDTLLTDLQLNFVSHFQEKPEAE